MQLEVLDARHAEQLLAFELENREWFARSITDRGDVFFAEFHDILADRLAEQASGEIAFHVLVDDDGSILGRFNLVDLKDGSADVGYRVAQRATGRGVATAGVLELCRLAAHRYALHRLTASTSEGNLSSQRVLRKAGFVAVGPADPGDIGGATGIRFERLLAGL